MEAWAEINELVTELLSWVASSYPVFYFVALLKVEIDSASALIPIVVVVEAYTGHIQSFHQYLNILFLF